MFPVVVGINYRTAPVEVRERVSVHHSQIASALEELHSHPEIKGVVILSTCNRLEVYGTVTEVEAGMHIIQDFLTRQYGDDHGSIQEYIYLHTLYPAVRHLFRVSAGLDSMVLGESEILGQVCKAYELACAAEANNKIINVMFQKALAVGKRVRTDTCIDQHSTSISYTAVELAKEELGEIQDKKILVLGAGEMSELIIKHLVAQGALTLAVSNRSLDRARSLASSYQAKAILFKDLDEYLERADLVFSATASKRFIIEHEQLRQVMIKRHNRPLFLVDIAVPRDIDPEVRKIEGVSLYDIDDLRGVVERHLSAKKEAADKAENIIEEEMASFKKWHNSIFVLPTISALQQRGEEIKNTELMHAFAKLGDLNPKQAQIIRSLANSIMNKFLHVPIVTLKELSNTPQGHLYTEIIQNLFDLNVNEELTSRDYSEALSCSQEMQNRKDMEIAK